MPEAPLLGGKRLEERLGDHVLDADEASVGAVGVIEEALPHLVIDVGAVVVRLYASSRVVSIGVEGI
jgi:hypothetical protein